MARRTKVFVVDDHPVVRGALREILVAADGLEHCGDADNAADALERILDKRPDVVLVDVSLGTSDGIGLTKTICQSDSNACVLVLSMHDEALYAEQALRAGASGYVMKRADPEVLLEAIRTVARGELWVSETIKAAMLRDFLGSRHGPKTAEFGVNRLSTREYQIFKLIGRGRTTDEISDMLRLNVKTVEAHRRHIKEKLKLRSATELLHRAMSWVQLNPAG